MAKTDDHAVAPIDIDTRSQLVGQDDIEASGGGPALVEENGGGFGPVREGSITQLSQTVMAPTP